MTDTIKRCALYVRVSSTDQNPTLQRDELREYAAWRKWDVVGVYEDKMSGAKDRRPGLDAMMADAQRGRFDVVAVWRFDRFARSTRHLLETLELFQSLHVDFVSLRESIDTSTATGKAMFTIIAAIAELERSTIRERVMAGQRAAKRKGVRFGRPTVAVDIPKVTALRKQGLSWRDISAKLQVPKDTLRRSLEQ